MDSGVFIVAIVAVAGGLLYAAFEEYQKGRLKAQQLRIEEKKLQMEQQLRNDELNAKILRMDDLGLSGAEIASLAEEVRRLREEVAQLKQDMNNRLMS